MESLHIVTFAFGNDGEETAGNGEEVRQTGLQKGKVVVEIIYDLENHIQIKEMNDSSASSNESLDEDANVSLIV